MKARRYGIWAGLAIVAAITSGALLAQAPQAIGTWVSVGDVSSPLTNGAVVALPDKRTLIAGGALADGTLTDAVTIYDSVDDSATAAGTLTSARADHTATLLEDGRVLVVGGMTADGLISSDIEIFDPATGTSAVVALLPEPRNGHVAAALPNGDVLIAGGATVDGVMLQTAVLFDPETSGVSSVPGHLHSARVHASATTMLDGRVLLAGGSNGTTELASAEIYDRYSQSFSIAATQMSVGRQGHSAVLLPDNGGVLVAGGTSNGVAQAGVDLFLPAVFPDPFSYGEGEFTATGAMTAARARAVAGPTSIEGFAFAAGGGAPDAEVYRFATIKTDKDDYAPGELATITGSGWQANEEVTLLFQEDPAVHDDYVLKVNADGNGNIFWNQWAPEHHDLGVRFYLTATGLQSRAQITFTDATSTTTVVNSSPNPSTSGQSVTVTATVTAGGTAVAQGSVKFYYGGQNCTGNAGTQFGPVDGVNLDGAGQASSATNALTNGVVVRACYGGFGSGSSALGASGGEIKQSVSASGKSDQTITFGGLAGKTYGDADFSVTATASSGLPVTFTASGQCAVTGATVHISGAGSCEVTANQSGNTQYNAAPDVPRMFTIAKATLIITWATPGDITYGTALSATQLNATADVAGSFIYTPAAGVTLNAGVNQQLSVAFTPTDATNYNGASKTVQITVLKATPTVTVQPVSATFDGAAHGTTGTVAGVNSAALGAATISYNTSDGQAPVNAGSYVATGAFAGNDNYTPASNTAAIVIAKATPTVTVQSVSVTFDGAAHGTTGTVAGVNNAALGAATISYNTADGLAPVNAGSYIATGTFAGNDNYTPASNTAAIVIAKATPTVTVQSVSVTFDGAAHGTTGTVAGVGGAALGAATISYNTADGQAPVNAGSYVATGTFAGNDNYTPASNTAAIVIAKATPTVTVQSVSVTFDGAAHGTTGTVAGVNNAALGAATISYNTADGLAPVNAGSYIATGTFAGNDNYAPASNTAAIVIAKATPTVTVQSVSVTFDGAAHGTTGTVAGVNNADLGAATISYNTTDGLAPVNAGSYIATGTFAGNDNYTPASNTAAIVIAKATPTVTVQSVSVTFDGAAHGTTGTVAGVNNADLGAATISYNTADGQAPMNAGSYVATGTFAGNDNYTPASNTAAIVIAKATPTVTVLPVSATFNGLAHPTTGTVAGVGGAALGAATISYNTSDGQAPVNAGSYVATGAFAGNDNYTPASNTAAIVIAKATPTVTVQSVSVTFDGAAHGTTGTVAGVNNADLGAATISYNTTDGLAPVNAGSYIATGTFAGNDNYTPASNTAAIVIAKATPTVTVQSVSVTFDGAAHGTTGTVAGVNNADLGAATISYNTADGQAPMNAGSYVATGTFAGNDNYTPASNTAAIVIAKATPTVTVLPVSATFNGLAHPTTGTVAGVGGAALGAATISYNTSDGQAPVNAGSYVATGAFAGNDNYTPASNTAAIVIAKATPTVTVQSVSVTFDGAAHGTTGTVAGVNNAALGAATISYNTADGQAPVNAGSYVATGTFAGNDNYAPASNTAAIVINKRTLTITPDGGKTKILGEVFTAFTGKVVGLQGTDNGTPTYASVGAAAGATVGSYDITVTFVFTSGAGSNYDVQLKTAVKGLVVLYRWDGFLQPINDTAHDLVVMSKFKAGQTIPAKFVLKNAAGASVQQTGIPTFTRTDRLGGCDPNAALETPEPLTVSVVPQYTWDGAQYHYNWSTKGLPAGLYRIFANIADGTAPSVDICLTK